MMCTCLRILFFSAAVLSAALVPRPALAAIGVTNSVDGVTVDNGASDGTTGVLFTTAEFEANGGNAVALLLSTEGTGGSVRTASFAGEAMEFVTIEQGSQTATVFYLVNPISASGTFEVTVDPGINADYAYGLLALSNVAGLASSVTANDTSSGGSLTLEYSVNTDGGYVLAAYANNAFSVGSHEPTFVSGNADIPLLAGVQIDTSGHLLHHGDVPTAGAYSDVFGNTRQRNAVSLAAFDAVIPEPGSLTLLGIAAIDFASSRRRS